MYLILCFNKLLMSNTNDYRDVIRNMCLPVSNYPTDVPNELVKCLQFAGDNKKGSKFEDYLSHNKILINDTLFEQYTNIFVSNNYIKSHNRKNMLHYYEIDDYPILCAKNIIKKYVNILRNNGYMPNILCLLKYPIILININDIYIPKEHEETVKYFLYNNIIEITQYTYLVQKLNNGDLNVIYELSKPIYKIKDLEKIYKDNPGTKPNKMHLIIAIKNSKCNLSVARMFVNFYVKHHVKCRELLIYVCSHHMKRASRGKLIDACRILGLFDDPIKVKKNGDNDSDISSDSDISNDSDKSYVNKPKKIYAQCLYKPNNSDNSDNSDNS